MRTWGLITLVLAMRKARIAPDGRFFAARAGQATDVGSADG